MSEFKTRDEITLANEFIGYLEQLKSGGVTQGTPGVGTNRALERLSENDNALLEALQSSRFPAMLFEGGSAISLTAGALLSWGGDLQIIVASEIGGATTNKVVGPASLGSISANDVLYVVLDRTTNDAAVPLVRATLAAYLALVAGAANRLDYFIVAFMNTQGLSFCNGTRLLIGQSLTNRLFTDTQYGQQTEVTQIREQQLDNLKLMLVGGGDISWDISGPNSMNWTGTFQMLFPAQGTGKFELSAGSKTIAPGEVAYLTLDRDAASGPITDASLGVIAIGSLVETDDTFVLAYHNATDTKLYLWDGTSLNDGDVVQLGGVRSGVQWFFKGAGTAPAGTPAIPHPGQYTDFEAALGIGTTYKVGTGELMVYRNGVKAKASLATWEGNSHPAGALVGVVEDYDEYLEEDPNTDGTGTRIIWLRDNTPDGAVGHPSATHDPPWTWPKSLATGEPDFLEAFVGIQGNQRSVSNVDGIYGFEMITTELGGSRVWTGGGVLVTAGDPYHHLADAKIYADPDTDLVVSESLSAPGWAYLYLKPGAAFGGPPDLVFSSSPPEALGYGVHPVQSDHRFLSSVYMDTVSQVRGFSKMGSYVSLSRGVHAIGPTPVGTIWPAPNAAFQEVVLFGTTPSTWPGIVRLRVGYTIDGSIAAGETTGIKIRGHGYTDQGREIYGPKPAAGSLYLEFDVPLLTDMKFEILQDSAEITSVDSVEMVGYYEGRHSTAIEMGV